MQEFDNVIAELPGGDCTALEQETKQGRGAELRRVSCFVKETFVRSFTFSSLYVFAS